MTRTTTATKGKRGRPKHVDHGTRRCAFEWHGLTGIDASTRYCSVTWMRHGRRVAAVAQYRNLDGVDITYLGMAHGEIHGTMHGMGDAKAHTVESLLNRPPQTQHDSVEALLILAVRSLEQAVTRAASGEETEDDEHPWVSEGRAEYDARVAAKAARS